MNSKKTVQLLVAISIPLFAIFALSISKQESELSKKRKEFNSFLDNHEYSKYNEGETDDLPKFDRPDLAMRQNYLMMVDPSTHTVPYEKTLQAFNYTKSRLASKSQQSNAVFKKIQNQSHSGTKSLYAPQFRQSADEPLIKNNSNSTHNYILNSQRKSEAISVGGEEVVWNEVGPDNVGGRTRAILWDPNDESKKRAFAGGVAGGLWVNDNVLDENSSWVAIDDFFANLAISSLAYDPTDTDILYAGTGEGYFNVDAVRGAGIMQSLDGGETWNFLPSTSGEEFAYVNKVVVTPNGSILAATRGSSSNGGVYRSTNDGATWTQVLSGSPGSDIEIASNGDIYASQGVVFFNGSVHKSSNDGILWTDVTPDDDSSSSAERIELAIAPTNSSVVYAIAQNGNTAGIDWFQKSIDGGSSWTNMSIPTHNDGCDANATEITRGQAWYDLILSVSPSDEDAVIAGGVDLAKTLDGGNTWTQISEWTNCSSLEDVHADHHAIVFRPDTNEALFGTDGGIYYSVNAGSAPSPSFEPRNKNYSVTQFYAVATDNVANSDYFIAGAQDNGTQQLSSTNGASATQVIGGDGAFCHIDQTNRTYQIGSSQNGNIRHSTDGGFSFSYIGGTTGANFINQTDYDNSTGILYSSSSADTYSRRTGFNTSSPSGESVIDVDLGGRQISAIRSNTFTSNRMFVGTEGGLVFRIDNADATPTPTNITSNISAIGNVSSIDVGASDNELIVTYSNFGVSSVWYSSNGGTSWVNKDDNDGLPDIPVRWALFNPSNTSQVLIATELGVWSTNDITSSPSWEPSNEGLANVRCDMLQYREIDGLVVVATHGRGMFTTNIFSSTADEAGPLVVSFTPADNELETSPLGTNLEIEFDEVIKKGVGNITLKLQGDNSIVEVIDVTSNQVSVSGVRAVINPSTSFVANTGYYIEVDAGSFTDNLGNSFAGFSSSETWNFTTFDGDEEPFVAIPISDLSIDEDSGEITIDITNVFSDSDNDDSSILKELISNNNTATLSAVLNANSLVLTPVADKIGQASIVVRGTSNGKTVDDTFVVTVNSISESLFSQTGSSGSGQLEGEYVDVDYTNIDDFEVPGGQSWEINTVTTEAFSLGSGSLNLQSVIVTIYEDIEGSPNTSNIVANQTINTNIGQLIGGSISNPSLTVRLNSVITLNPGNYWMSVHPVFSAVTSNALYAWFQSANTGNSYQDDGSGFESLAKEMLFTVDGEAIISDFPPVVSNPIGDLTIDINPETNPVLVDLSNTFTDPDNDDAQIGISVVSNSNTALITNAAVNESSLELTIATDEVGTSEITLRATSNGLTVDESFVVSVVSPVLFSQSGEASNGSPSQQFPDFSNSALESADDFEVPEGTGWVISQVFVEGSRNESSNAPIQAVVFFYEDNEGLPGNVVFESTPTNVSYTNDDTDFSLTLDDPITLLQGKYWISVQTVQEFDGGNQWFWSWTPTSGDYVRQDADNLLGGDWPLSWGVSGNSGALIFSLNGGEVEFDDPVAPTALAATNQIGNTFTASWTPNNIAFDFEIDVTPDDFTTFVDGFESKSVSGNSTTVTVPGSGNYSYRVRAVNPLGTSANSNVIDVTVVILDSENFGRSELKVYPNPVTSALRLNAGEDINHLDVSLYSLSGKKVFQKKDFDPITDSINLTQSPSGTYVLKYLGDNIEGQVLIVKQ